MTSTGSSSVGEMAILDGIVMEDSDTFVNQGAGGQGTGSGVTDGGTN